MRPRHIRAVIVAAMSILIIVSMVILALPLRSIPVCMEDVVLVGYGSFEDGRYAYYACGPALDDYVGD